MESGVINGDCLDVLKTLPDASVDSVVTDPPYGLSFMGKKWDYDVPTQQVWEECLRVLKPGGHLLSFFGTRTYHRGVVRIEDAGFEIRDQIGWAYGSGFPKSHNLNGDWEGWGTALKPAWEPIVVARKPLIGTVSENVLKHGTGAINVDGCRVGNSKSVPASPRGGQDHIYGAYGAQTGEESGHNPNLGRWPANLCHDGSDEVLARFPDGKSGVPGIRRKPHETGSMSGRLDLTGETETGYGDSGSAARFFYCAKASKRDRDEGLESFVAQSNMRVNGPREDEEAKTATKRANHHPTVKPTDLMRWLVRLVTPPGGTVLDPFCGSGSTGKAAKLEGFSFIGIEREAEYVEIANARINAADTRAS